MRFVLSHRHAADQCGVAYAAWKGFDSPLRHGSALATCGNEPGFGDGDHLLVWTVEAGDESAALAQLPPWLAERAEARHVKEALIP